MWAGGVCVATQTTMRAPDRPAASRVGQSTPRVDYQQQVHPILAANCLGCHSAEKRSGGLLPPPGELQAFIADTSPSKRISLVDRLLADRAKYAEHWISFWNDLLRNDEGVNYYSETASRKSITEWLLAALESNLPYNRFVG